MRNPPARPHAFFRFLAKGEMTANALPTTRIARPIDTNKTHLPVASLR